MLSDYFFEILKNKNFDLSKSELQAEPNRSYYKRVYLEYTALPKFPAHLTGITSGLAL